MSDLVLALLLFVQAQSQPAVAKQEIAVGERFMAAIKGKSDFRDGDFARPVHGNDKAVLRRFAKCRVKHLGHILIEHPKRPNLFFEDRNNISVTLDCKGVPSNLPVSISLKFQDGKIVGIETHNADLMDSR